MPPSPFDDLDWPPRQAPVLPSFGGLLIGLIPAVVVATLGYLQIRSDKSPGDHRTTWVALWINAIGAFGVCLRIVTVDLVIVGLLFVPLGLSISSGNLLSRLGHIRS